MKIKDYQEKLKSLLEGIFRRNDGEAIRALAALVFPLKPGEEGWYSEECEMVAGAYDHASPDCAEKIFHLLGPEWRVDNLAQHQADGRWWCNLHRPVEGDENGNITRHSLSASSFDNPSMAVALMSASIQAMLEIEREKRG